MELPELVKKTQSLADRAYGALIHEDDCRAYTALVELLELLVVELVGDAPTPCESPEPSGS